MQKLYTQASTTAGTTVSTKETSKVLRSTYALLAMTFTFSAFAALMAMIFKMPPMNPLLMLAPYFILLWLTEKNKNSAMGLVWVFALTGWLGLSIGPLVGHVSSTVGFEPILMSLGGTAIIFFGLSGYVLTTRKDLSFMSGFLMTGLLVGFVAVIANLFLQIQGLSLAISCMFLLLSSGIIAWYTSVIIHGGETNYISATVMLFVAIYNIFISLLSLFVNFGND